MASENGVSSPQSISQRQRYTLRDVWHAIQTERDFNYAFWMDVTLTIMFESAMKQFGMLLVGMAIILIGLVSLGGFFMIIPIIADSWTLWFYFNVVWGKYFVTSS